ncbi:MAG TPA: toll/interleukin-1 receptor domain-containing protein [Pyrinomonadaceae bacterium]|jgi:hypothetical protein
MADPEHLKLLLEYDVFTWNNWRESNPEVTPDLSEAILDKVNLIRFNLSWANLNDARLSDVDLSKAILDRADLRDAYLFDTNLEGADLIQSNLEGATLFRVTLREARLVETILRFTTLFSTNLDSADLTRADFADARIADVNFIRNDLSVVNNLHSVRHSGPSNISIDTLYISSGGIPEVFLHGCGVPESFIFQVPALVASIEPIQFHSCFISYSTKDEGFARRLYSRMRDEKLRVWFAPEDIKGGQKLHEQIERAIQLHDRLLLVLSENSMQSEWVITEIQGARKTEIEENRRKLFPITIVNFDKVKTWKCFDADSGKDLAKEVREYYIPDFSNWKDQDSFEKAFDRLLRDLKAEEK